MRYSKLSVLMKMVVLLIMFSISICFLTTMLDKHYTYYTNMQEYYIEADSVEMVTLGPSTIYNSINPIIIEEKTGIANINLSSPAQNLKDSYYLLKDVYRTAAPTHVLIGTNIVSIQAEVDKNASQIVLGSMEHSIVKSTYYLEGFNIGEFLYYFNIEPKSFSFSNVINGTYVDRLLNNEMDPQKLHYEYVVSNTEYYKGYVPNSGEYNSTNEVVYQFGTRDENIDYLHKIIELAQVNGSKVMLITPPLSPSQMNYTDDFQQYFEYLNAVAEEYGIVNLDFNLLKSEYFSHSYDYFADDLHIRYTGAEIVSKLLGEIIAEIDADKFDSDNYFYRDFYAAHADKFASY